MRLEVVFLYRVRYGEVRPTGDVSANGDVPRRKKPPFPARRSVSAGGRARISLTTHAVCLELRVQMASALLRDKVEEQEEKPQSAFTMMTSPALCGTLSFMATNHVKTQKILLSPLLDRAQRLAARKRVVGIWKGRVQEMVKANKKDRKSWDSRLKKLGW